MVLVTSALGTLKRQRESSEAGSCGLDGHNSPLRHEMASAANQILIPVNGTHETGVNYPLKKRIMERIVNSQINSCYSEPSQPMDLRGVIQNGMASTGTISPVAITSGSDLSQISESVQGIYPTTSGPKRPKYRASRPPLLPPCRVCQDRASGFHYGVNTCEACKGFFRRSIMKKQQYICVGNGDCKTTHGNRTTCSACRYKKCIEVGMSKDAIKTGRYTHELRSKNILEVKSLRMQESLNNHVQHVVTPQSPTSPIASSSTPLSNMERRIVYDMTMDMLVEGQKMLFEFLDDYFNDELLLERQMQVYSRYLKEKLKTSLSGTSAKTKPIVSLSKEPADDSCSPSSSCRESHDSTESSLFSSGDKPNDISNISATTKSDIKVESETDNNDNMEIRDPEKSDPHEDHSVESAENSNAQPEVFVSSRTPDDAVSVSSQLNEGLCSGLQMGNDMVLESELALRNKKKNSDNFNTVYIEDERIENALHKSSNRTNDCIYNEKFGKRHQNGENDFMSGNVVNDRNTTIEETIHNLSDDIKTGALSGNSLEQKRTVIKQVLTDMEKGVLGVLSFAKCLPGFKDLPKDDQATLVKASRFDIWYIGHIRCFNSELRVGACEWQFHINELSEVWGPVIADLAFSLSKLGQDLHLTKEETACLRAMSLTFADRCYPLIDRHAVEQIHEHMFELFRYTASRRVGNFNIWFTRVINFLSLLREFGVELEKVSSNLAINWDVISKNPYLLAAFLS